ncbi:MAG: response regulator [Myxococcales bacterium]|nr:MAG: response regulator [Myxococcales bacterium]
MLTRILVIDHDAETRRWLEHILSEAGFGVLCTENIDEATAVLAQQQFGLLLLEQAPESESGLRWLKELRARNDDTAHMPVIMVASKLEHADEVEIITAFEAGADEFLRKPLRAPELLARIHSIGHMRKAQKEAAQKQKDAEILLELTQRLSSSRSLRDNLQLVVSRVAEATKADRVSIVAAPDSESSNDAFVVASSGTASIRNLPLDLRNYPEIHHVLKTNTIITIDDPLEHELFESCREKMRDTQVTSITVLPIAWKERPLAALILRSTSEPICFDERVNFVKP